MAFSADARRTKRRAGGVVERRRAAEFKFCHAACDGRPGGGIKKPAYAHRLVGRTRRLVSGAAKMASRRRHGGRGGVGKCFAHRSEENTSELQSRPYLVCRPP